MSDHVGERQLSDFLGLELHGWDLKKPLTASQVHTVCGLLYQYGLLCFRNQNLTPEQLADFGGHLGKPILHNEENLRLKKTPCVMTLSNADERNDRQLNGGAHWHTDLIHSDDPASFTMLNAVAVPKEGGGTLFASQVAAYDALSQSQQQEIDGLIVSHCYEGRTDGSMPTFRHPLVRKHPVTGQKALYGAWDTGIGIVGMSSAAGRAYLEKIAMHATNARFVYRHRYSLNDLVIWDNAQLLHSAERLERARQVSENRIMHRVSVRGWPGS